MCLGKLKATAMLITELQAVLGADHPVLDNTK